MARPRTLRPFVLVGLALILVVNAMLFGGRLTAWVSDALGPVIAPVSLSLMRARMLMSTAFGVNDTASRIIDLEAEITSLRAQIANQEELRREIAFYRDASGIRDRIGKDPIKAAIFSYPQAGGVRQAVINRGRADWVVVGDIVVTPAGALIGAVSQVFEHHAVVRVVGDIGLDVTVRILGSDVSGLLRTTAEDGTGIDLVQKDEAVAEQAVVVTSGDDWYPAGLIVGTVRSVDNDAATLFKIVRVTPVASTDIAGDVVIIRP